jgi:membrane protease YdiL (CAAX protease family)
MDQTISDAQALLPRRRDALAVLFALVFPTLLTWVYFVLLKDCSAPIQFAAYGVGKSVQFAFPLIWVLAIQRGRLRWVRLGTAGLAPGLGFGLVALIGILGLYYVWLGPVGLLTPASAAIHSKAAGFALDTPAGFFAMGAFYSVAHSLLEEYYWRWFVFGQLRRLIPVWPAILISSVGFMAHHVVILATYFGWSPLTVLFSLGVAVAGVVWAWIYQRSGSLWGPWLSHLLVDAAIFIVGYDLIRNMLSP